MAEIVCPVCKTVFEQKAVEQPKETNVMTPAEAVQKAINDIGVQSKGV